MGHWATYRRRGRDPGHDPGLPAPTPEQLEMILVDWGLNLILHTVAPPGATWIWLSYGPLDVMVLEESIQVSDLDVGVPSSIGTFLAPGDTQYVYLAWGNADAPTSPVSRTVLHRPP